MANSLVSFKGANLPSVSSLSTALRSVQTDAGVGGVAILKMDKGGHWVFGADQTEVEDGSRWAVNPFSFVHGWIAWGDGDVLGEKMVSVAQPLPETDVAPPQSKRGWERQIGLSLKCMDGEDKGLEVRYSTTSVGGKRAVEELATMLAEQVDKDADHPVAVVHLDVDHYQHKSYGKIYTPVFELVEWVGLNGESSAESAEEAPAAEPAGRRRRSA